MNKAIEHYISRVVPVAELLSYSLANELINLLLRVDHDTFGLKENIRIQEIHRELLSLAYEKMIVYLSVINIEYCLKQRYEGARYMIPGDLMKMNKEVVTRKGDELYNLVDMIYDHDQKKTDGVKQFVDDLKRFSVSSRRYQDITVAVDQFVYDVDKFLKYYITHLNVLNVRSETEKAFCV